MTIATALKRPTTAGLVEQAARLVPVLRERAAECEAGNKVPADTIRDFQDAGFFKILQPTRYGGYEMDVETFYQVQMKVAEGCMSSAWVLGVVAVHNWQLALFAPQAQEDVWGEDPSTLISSSYMPRAQVTPVEGGYRITGRWGFSSGVDHCDWAFLGGLVKDPETGEPDFWTFLVPRGDFQVLPIWNTIGLGGTGSHDVTVDDAFVPAYRTHRSKDGFAATNPGAKVNPGALYKLPFGQVFVRAVSSSSIGALQGALDLFLEIGARRVSNNSGASATGDPDVQMLIAETQSAIDEMKTMLFRNFAHLNDRARRGEQADLETRLRFRFQSAQIATRCCELISRIYYSGGADGIYRGNPIARAFCDIHTGRTHVANNPNSVGRNYGKVALGQPNTDSFI
ncbi:3-hydroxy-9,10-secoandrosta-1,3,5(10)-triene-9,17-dione monooxygenase [Sphingobium sp. OAS761]|uniref:flavin-dependent monooxygenase n=1 Tax=Sphingobium sp. OAS761 TaxID=2817901 RepID=UPI0020A09B3E|nr:flavin-dependent monooxygenase [Sphingobium sp. OAS761]MCP1471772.1 3-hydroxy-9,10-secoandrosta-1,3,5(10)-triene-9,17-dione monooxygenase [Sphingobium sp. OAS761]